MSTTLQHRSRASRQPLAPSRLLPGDIAASRRYFVPDLIDPPIEVSADGLVRVPGGHGIGVQVNWDRVRAATIETYDVRA